MLALILYASICLIYPVVKNGSWTPSQQIGILLAVVLAFMAFYVYFAMNLAPGLAEKITDKWERLKEETRKEAPYVALMLILAILALFFGVYALWHPGEWGALATTGVLLAFALWLARHVLH